jgi:hypothetical protein
MTYDAHFQRYAKLKLHVRETVNIIISRKNEITKEEIIKELEGLYFTVTGKKR